METLNATKHTTPMSEAPMQQQFLHDPHSHLAVRHAPIVLVDLVHF
jgi:hypothetical protein